MPLSRRGLLTAVVAGAASAAACSAPGPPQLPPPAPRARPGGAVDWDALAARLPGGLLRPGSADYDRARRVYNIGFDGRRPAALAVCGSADDVRACLDAAGGRVPVAALGGGHGYGGYALPDGGLVVDLRRMNGVAPAADGTVAVGPGALLRDVYDGVAAAGRALPAGFCPTVGITGLLLGGGIGPLARSMGLTCDRLIAAEVVTGDGRVLTASAASEPDLFWALRGGGGGNAGIVTALTLSTEPAPAVLTVFTLTFSAADAAAACAAWRDVMAGAPRELWCNLTLSANGRTATAKVAGCLVGDDAAPWLDALARGTAGPRRREVRRLGFAEAMRHFGAGGDRQDFVASSRIVPGPSFDPEDVLGPLAGRRRLDVILDPLGGRVADPAPGDTAFVHRTAFATAQVYATVTDAGRDAAASAVAEVLAGLAARGMGGGYVNYIDPALPGWGRAYHGDNLARLQRVAATYDPDRVLGFAQDVRAAVA
ncbi:FAD-binding oxidoreductase [Pseudonocardia spirodelae]|uniref:FAD-binding protein n=1 Tax=Pseudonocardia spirodelae TaxID=3133431 RepID=A0ABU8T6J4_9PSEU